MTDEQATQLLELIHLYVTTYGQNVDAAMTIREMTDDLAMSMDIDTDHVKTLVTEIMAALQ